jgi:anti-sigma regulatory factor (Ser/Thr protein kinase)
MSAPYTLDILADLKQLEPVRRFIEDAAGRLGIDPESAADMVQAVDEAVTNLIVHAYKGTPGPIIIEARRDQAGAFVVTVRDQSPPFDPTGYPAPDLTVPLEERRAGGLGIFMMHQFTDGMTYKTDSEGYNELTFFRGGVSAQEASSMASRRRTLYTIWFTQFVAIVGIASIGSSSTVWYNQRTIIVQG